MRICIVAEGCYPFVSGGVSSWLQDMIQRMPEHEFVIWSVGAQEKMRGHYAYKIPINVMAIYDEYLDSALHMQAEAKIKLRLSIQERQALKDLILCKDPNWSTIFSCFQRKDMNPISFMLDKQFLSILKEVCKEQYPAVPFVTFFWTVRSMFLPLMYLISGKVPEAAIYHSVSAGYAGVLAAMAANLYNKPYILTEHGIYTREREEEILRSLWIPPQFKNMWIDMFYMFTRCAYQEADQVTSLFVRASEIQREIGCEPWKQMIIPNGVHVDHFENIALKCPDGWVDIGAIVRVVPIKDIKTMIYAFAQVYEEMKNVRLHIMGPSDEDEVYYKECVDLAAELGLDTVCFTGRVDVRAYMVKIDFTLLTSISEGMPLAILEGMSAGRPVVATDVGCCRELIEGVNDDFGHGGLCVPVMHQRAIAEAILKLCRDVKLRLRMGQNALSRMQARFQHGKMISDYQKVYRRAVAVRENRLGVEHNKWQE